MDDVRKLRKLLADLDHAAKSQRWDAQRPWRTSTHVFWEADVPSLDGHDLSAKLMKRALRAIAEEADGLSSGAVRVITGRGSHSVGGAVLGDVVRGVWGPLAAEHGWQLKPHGSAAWVLIIDRKKAPRSATGDWGCGMWLLVAGFAAAALLAIFGP